MTTTTTTTTTVTTADELIESHVGLVGHIVREALGRVPRHVHVDDLTSAAMTALVLAGRSFDPARGVAFTHYARTRIRGAVLDELRSMDWASRAVRTNARTLSTVEDQLTSALGRAPRIDELSAATGMSVEEIRTVQRDAARANTTSLDEFASESVAVSASDADPETLLLFREQMGYLHHAVEQLPDRLKHIVVAHFFHQRPHQDIADELGVTGSRVSQLQTEAMRLMRAGLSEEIGPEVEQDTTPVEQPRRSSKTSRTTAAYLSAVRSGTTVASRLAASNPLGEPLRHPPLAHAS